MDRETQRRSDKRDKRGLKVVRDGNSNITDSRSNLIDPSETAPQDKLKSFLSENEEFLINEEFYNCVEKFITNEKLKKCQSKLANLVSKFDQESEAIFKNQGLETPKCPVCYDAILLEKSKRQLKCLHEICVNCYIKLFHICCQTRLGVECPLCRKISHVKKVKLKSHDDTKEMLEEVPDREMEYLSDISISPPISRRPYTHTITYE